MRRLLICLALAGFVSACSVGAAPSYDAGSVLKQAGPALAAVKSVSIDLKFGKGATFQGFTLVSAAGKVKLPSDSDTILKAQQTQDSLLELRLVTVGGQVYIQAPFIGFTTLTGAEAARVPSIARIFDPQSGLPGLLAQGTKVNAAGSEMVDGVDCYKITAVYPAALVGQAVQPLNPDGDVAATLWIGKTDHLLRKAHLEGNLFTAGQKSSVDVHLHDFNAVFDIAKPI